MADLFSEFGDLGVDESEMASASFASRPLPHDNPTHDIEEPLPKAPPTQTDLGQFDINLLIERLEEYKAQVDQSDTRLRWPKSVSPEQTAAVATAAPLFHEDIESGALRRPPPLAMRPILDPSTWMTQDPYETSKIEDRAASFQDSAIEVAEMTRPRLIRSSSAQSKQFPARSSSLRSPPQKRPRSVKIPVLVKSHQSTILDYSDIATFGSVKAHGKFAANSELRFSVSNTITSTPEEFESLGSSNPHPSNGYEASRPIKGSPLLMASPDEDRIRRELESLAIQEDGDDLLQQRKWQKDWQSSTIHIIQLEPESGEEQTETHRPFPKHHQDMFQPPPGNLDGWIDQENKGRMKKSLKRKFSVFSIIRRKTTAEKLIDLYMSDEQLREMNSVNRKESRMRKRMK